MWWGNKSNTAFLAFATRCYAMIKSHHNIYPDSRNRFLFIPNLLISTLRRVSRLLCNGTLSLLLRSLLRFTIRQDRSSIGLYRVTGPHWVIYYFHSFQSIIRWRCASQSQRHLFLIRFHIFFLSSFPLRVEAWIKIYSPARECLFGFQMRKQFFRLLSLSVSEFKP